MGKCTAEFHPEEHARHVVIQRKISSMNQRLFINDVKRTTKIDGIGPFKKFSGAAYPEMPQGLLFNGRHLVSRHLR